MTYLIIGNNQSNIKVAILEIISQSWKKEIEENLLDLGHPDIHLLESKNIKSFGIEDVKTLQKEMIFSPYSEKSQIAIVFNAEKLTTEAQNSFLKTLEDSGETSIYILATTNEKNLLPTILSRSQKIYTKEKLEEKREISKPNILSMSLVDAFQEIEKIAKNRKDTESLLDEINAYFQGILEMELDSSKHPNQICANIQEVVKIRRRVDANGNRRLLLENLFLVLTS